MLFSSAGDPRSLNCVPKLGGREGGGLPGDDENRGTDAPRTPLGGLSTRHFDLGKGRCDIGVWWTRVCCRPPC